MKVVILAGGFGTRISEESQTKPKPMIEIGGMPILWHIMKEYSYYGYHEFIICAGYQQVCIKDWFANYFRRHSDYTIDFTGAKEIVQIHECHVEPWRVTLVDTGLNTMTGGRIKRIQRYVGDEPFFMTYGDGVCDVNINEFLKFHQGHGKKAVGLSYLVGIHWGYGLVGMWVCFALDENIRGVILMRRWRSGKWKKKSFV